jgi:predicted ATPase
MKRVLLTGMSGVGKSTVVARLAELGYRSIDTDEGGFTVEVRSEAGTERLWREDRLAETVEPLLRAAATLEVDTRAPVDEVVSTIVRHVTGHC